MADLIFDGSLIVRFDEDGLTTSDVESKLADVLFGHGYVKDTYKQAILDREVDCPTALDVSGLNVAMPHCDVAHVNEGAICMGVLKRPVDWHRMDDPEATCPVSLVVMLALNEAHAHLEMLQKVIALIQDQELVRRIIDAEDVEAVFELAKSSLSNKDEEIEMVDCSNEHWTVAGTAVTFGTFHKGSVEALEAAGCTVKLNPYGRPLTNEEMIEFAGDCDALIVGNDKVPAEVIKHFKNMKVIAKHGVGVDAIDKDQAKKQGILVTNAPGTNKDEVADAAMCLVLMLARDFHTLNAHTKDHKWIKYPGVDVVGKTIGVIGAGNIGTAFIRRCTGFTDKILVNDLVERDEVKAMGAVYVDKETIYRECDIISLHVPLDDSTYHLIGEEAFSMMRPGTIFVNTARSKCVEVEPLTAALKDGTLRGYGVDVYDFEPPAWQEFFDFPNVILTPHVAGTTIESNARMGDTAAANVIAVKRGVTPPNLITFGGASA